MITKFLGALLALRLIYEGVIFVGKWYMDEDLDHLELVYGKGSYAIVTGGTSGIGLEFAKQLASAGFNIVNISRSAEKLQAAEEMIRQAAKHEDIKIVSVQKNFTGANQVEFYSEIEQAVEGLDVSLLVNNVGITWDCMKPLAQAKYENLAAVVTVNCNSQVGMLRTFLPRLVKRAQNGVHKSGVIDLSSVSCLFPDDKLNSYGATKLFNKFLTNGLNNDIDDRVNFLSVQPSFVRTNMAQEFEEKGFEGFIDTDECVRGALSNFGRFKESPGGKGHLGTWYTLGFLQWALYNTSISYFLKKLMVPPKLD